MSSSPELIGSDAEVRVEPYVYPLPFPLDSTREADLPVAGPAGPVTRSGTAPDSAISEEQVKSREKRAWELGIKEGEARGRLEQERILAAERAGIAQALREFATEREQYFARVETQLVRLALAIARKILHREAQIDPLLLAGVVRVALEKLSAGTRVRLRVPPDQVKPWQEFFAQQPELQCKPELMGDPSQEPGHCFLETELGSTDLTLETQLQEVEQGFFDLLAQRPRKHE